jgi:hypothetical protein
MCTWMYVRDKFQVLYFLEHSCLRITERRHKFQVLLLLEHSCMRVTEWLDCSSYINWLQTLPCMWQCTSLWYICDIILKRLLKLRVVAFKYSVNKNDTHLRVEFFSNLIRIRFLLKDLIFIVLFFLQIWWSLIDLNLILFRNYDHI